MVNKDSSMDGVADFLGCLGNLERKNSKLFENLANKTVLPSVKQQLSKIAQDNESHAEILTGMSEQIGNTKIKTKDCKKKLSTVCETTEAILEQVSKKEKITAKDFSVDNQELNFGSIFLNLICDSELFYGHKAL
ncbi:hypothetical protein MUO71_01625 [Candidatus Bathyarchaeota archaeon]|nr:hypothetical protein [Candidatus Bathyarchaeota archaeon]